MGSTGRCSDAHSEYLYLGNDLVINEEKIQFLIRKLEFNMPSIREEERMFNDGVPRIQDKFDKHPENISCRLQS
jgi:hypothetical protein